MRRLSSNPIVRRLLPGAIGILLLGDLVGLATLPSGSRHLSGVIPAQHRVLLSRSVGSVRVLVTERAKDLRLLVAYREHHRWHSVKVEPARGATNAAWAATNGAGPVPAFSAVYGRTDVGRVVVRWKDGKTTEVVPVKGAYLAVRRGHVTPEGVDLSPAPAP